MLFVKEVLDPNFGMFVNFDTMYAVWFNGYSFEDLSKFYFVGIIHHIIVVYIENFLYPNINRFFFFFLSGYVCGLAVYNCIMIDLTFPLALYKKLLDEPVNYQDLYPTAIKFVIFVFHGIN